MKTILIFAKKLKDFLQKQLAVLEQLSLQEIFNKNFSIIQNNEDYHKVKNEFVEKAVAFLPAPRIMPFGLKRLAVMHLFD